MYKVKGTRCLGSVELVFKKHLLYIAHGKKDVLKVENNDTHKFASHKWPTTVVDEVKGKPCNFDANLCGLLYSTFQISF